MPIRRSARLVLATAAVATVVAGGWSAKAVLDNLAQSPVALTPTRSPSPSPSALPSSAPALPPTLDPSPPPPTTSPPGPPPAPRPCRYEGKRATEKEIKAALEAAARKQFWQNSATINIPASLIKAVAQHESGWQSNAVSCAGAYGVMQVMPDTQTWMNQRFLIEPPYDRKTLAGNTMLGSAYLQWLVKEMGDKHFGGDYTLRPCATSTEKCLLNAVISAFEAGHQAVHDEIQDGDSALYPNPDYVANVRYWMARY